VPASTPARVSPGPPDDDVREVVRVGVTGHGCRVPEAVAGGGAATPRFFSCGSAYEPRLSAEPIGEDVPANHCYRYLGPVRPTPPLCGARRRPVDAGQSRWGTAVSDRLWRHTGRTALPPGSDRTGLGHARGDASTPPFPRAVVSRNGIRRSCRRPGHRSVAAEPRARGRRSLQADPALDGSRS
jgi:hypothetical protein